jgi:ankyrin repeat protein
MDANSKLRKYILQDNLNGVKEEIEKGCDINVVVDDVTGLTPLGLAALHSRRQIVSMLINAKADVNARNTNKAGVSILYNVLCFSKFDIIQQLLEANALVNDIEFKDFTPLAYCCCHHNDRDFNLLNGRILMDYGAKLELVPHRISIPDSFKEYNTTL